MFVQLEDSLTILDQRQVSEGVGKRTNLTVLLVLWRCCHSCHVN